MKKLILVLLTIVLFVPKTIYSSIDVPTFVDYKVKVNNEQGITLIDSNKNIIIPNNTILEVNYEYEKDGKLYGIVEYENHKGSIEINETMLFNSEVDLNNYEGREEKKIYVLGEDVYLYNGPSKIYGKVEEVSEIPVGTLLTYKYGDSAWAYTTYNNKTGWVYIYTYDNIIYEKGAKIATVYDDSKLYTLKNIELVESPFNDTKTNIQIPSTTFIEYKYSYSKNQNDTYYYVKYGKIEGWYHNKPLEVAEVYNEEFIVNSTENNKIYELPDDNSKILAEISKDEEYRVIALSTNDDIDNSVYESWSYVEYKDIKGWIHSYEKLTEEEKNSINDSNYTNNSKQNKKSYKLYIVFAISIAIIVLFIIYTMHKIKQFNKENSDKNNA